jgi:hypothetical protein
MAGEVTWQSDVPGKIESLTVVVWRVTGNKYRGSGSNMIALLRAKGFPDILPDIGGGL